MPPRQDYSRLSEDQAFVRLDGFTKRISASVGIGVGSDVPIREEAAGGGAVASSPDGNEKPHVPTWRLTPLEVSGR